jgi:hypothetical protein
MEAIMCARADRLLLHIGTTQARRIVLDLIQHSYFVVKTHYVIAGLPVHICFAAVGLACPRIRMRIVASWIEQIGNGRLPESLDSLTTDRTRILLMNVHAAGAPALDSLRADAVIFRQTGLGLATIADFRLKSGQHFEVPSIQYMDTG